MNNTTKGLTSPMTNRTLSTMKNNSKTLPFKGLIDVPGVKPEKNSLYGPEIVEARKILKKKKAEALAAEKKVIDLLRKERELNGIKQALIEEDDLYKLAIQILSCKDSLKDIFGAYETKEKKPKGWGGKILKREIHKGFVTRVLSNLENGGALDLILKHKQLDKQSLRRSTSYSQLCNKLRKQHRRAVVLQSKDDQNDALKQSNSTLVADNKSLRETQALKKPTTWQEQALQLCSLGYTVTKIAEMLGLSRQTVTTYLAKERKKGAQ